MSHHIVLMKKYQAQAETNSIKETLSIFPKEEEKEFRLRLKNNDLRLFAFLNRNVATIMEPAEESPVVFLLFDKDGCLLELYGNSTEIAALQTGGIVKRSFWHLNDLGPNAITVGLAEKLAMTSIGEENYNCLLKQYALYFSPIMVCVAKSTFETLDYGGMAIIVPAAKQNRDYLMLVTAITHDIIMTLHFNNTAFMLYERNGRAILSIDTYIHEGTNTITHCSREIFEIFNIPSMDLLFMPATRLLDPLPANKEFWSIIKERERVTDHGLTLSGQGKKIFCIVSTEIFEQPGINAGGIVFYITTPQQISASVSERIGNSAVRNFENIIGQSPAIKSAVQRGKMLAKTDSNIMLLGESGVGKDVFAQAIHNSSRRQDKPFIAVNCGALPRDLITSELFGYSSGAFTGAKRQGNIGKFELANGGTIFLDEIGELPLDLQATILRVVEQKQLMRLGSNELINVDVKIVSATNADIKAMIEQKRFRIDLYYRLSTMQLNVPSLRERGLDIILLAEYFIHSISTRIGRKDIMTLSPATKELLLILPWHGNVRELQNLIESIVQLYPDPTIEPQHIWENLYVQDVKYTESIHSGPILIEPNKKLRKTAHGRYVLTKQDINVALENCGGNRSEAARELGLSRKTLYRYIERFGI